MDYGLLIPNSDAILLSWFENLMVRGRWNDAVENGPICADFLIDLNETEG